MKLNAFEGQRNILGNKCERTGFAFVYSLLK